MFYLYVTFSLVFVFQKEPSVLNHALTLGFNKQGAGHVSDPSLGQIFVSITFRPVPSVEKSGRTYFVLVTKS